MAKRMDHAEYQKICKHRTLESLLFVVKDAQEAIKANPDGDNAGYYADEIHYCNAELVRRGHYRLPSSGLMHQMVNGRS